MALVLSYLAWFGLYHADPRRSGHAFFSSSSRRTGLTRIMSSVLIACTLLVCVVLSGIERGIALWLAALMGAGTIFMFMTQIYPKAGRVLGVFCLVVVPAIPIMLVLGGS